MGFIARAKVGQKVDFRKPGTGLLTGVIIRVAGDVYTVKLGSEDTRPVHHKFLVKLHPMPAPAEEQVTA
jgi:hypothetical protein